MSELERILMERDGLSRKEVQEQIQDFKDNLLAGELGYDAEEAFMEEFCLEPDFILDLF